MKITQLLEAKKGVKAPKYATKPRNFVAKNMTTGGAGAHKDKKKAAKQGDVKHKAKELAENNNFVDTVKNAATKVGDALSTALPQDMRPFDNQTAANNVAKYKQAKEDQDNEKDIIAVDVPLLIRLLEYAREDAKTDMDLHDVAERLIELSQEGRTLSMQDYDSICPSQDSIDESHEYDDETGMASNQLQTIQRCSREMEANLIDGENLPEWVQSKITIAKENLVTAFDYMVSQHQNGDVMEGALDELHSDLSDKFNELAPSITKHKDKQGASQLYNELVAVAKQHGTAGVQALKSMLNNAQHSAHMDYDTNPGGFENWFWYLPLGDDQNVEEGGMYRRPGSPSAYKRDEYSAQAGMGKHDSLAYQLDGGANDEGWDKEPYQAPQDKPVLQGYYFYNVQPGQEDRAASLGVKQTKSGKWAKAKYSTSGRSFGMQKDMADKEFGPGKWWAPK